MHLEAAQASKAATGKRLDAAEVFRRVFTRPAHAALAAAFAARGAPRMSIGRVASARGGALEIAQQLRALPCQPIATDRAAPAMAAVARQEPHGLAQHGPRTRGRRAIGHACMHGRPTCSCRRSLASSIPRSLSASRSRASPPRSFFLLLAPPAGREDSTPEKPSWGLIPAMCACHRGRPARRQTRPQPPAPARSDRGDRSDGTPPKGTAAAAGKHTSDSQQADAWRVTAPVRRVLAASATWASSSAATSPAARRSACPSSGGQMLHSTSTEPCSSLSTRMRLPTPTTPRQPHAGG